MIPAGRLTTPNRNRSLPMKPFFRILATLVCLLALAAGLLYYLGGKQIQYVAKTRIKSSADTVMEYLTNPQFTSQWGEGVVQWQPASESDDNDGDGAELKIEVDGTQYDMDYQLLSSSDRSLAMRTSSEMFDSVATWQLLEDGESVNVRNLVLTRYRGWHRLTALFNRAVVEEQLQVDLSRLKSLVETGKVIDPRAPPGDFKKQAPAPSTVPEKDTGKAASRKDQSA